MTDIADYMIICSGSSKRHLHILADHLAVELKKQQHPPLSVEGSSETEWILVDAGDVIVHIMLPHIRKFYDLEKLWGIDIVQNSRKS